MYNEALGVWLTDYSESPNKIEFLCFEEGSYLPELIKTTAHLAYQVPDLEEALKDAHVIFPPFVCSDTLTIAFIEEEGIGVELMEIK